MGDRHRPIRLHIRAQVYAVVLTAASAPVGYAGETATWPARPPLSAACEAWESHIRNLVEQNRHSADMDDAAFGDALALFYAARSYCTLGNPELALSIYGALPLRPVVQGPLR
jgi:hypothetical protein